MNIWIDDEDEWLSRSLPREFFLPPDDGGLPWTADIVKTFAEIPDRFKEAAEFLWLVCAAQSKAASYHDWPNTRWARFREFLHVPIAPEYVLGDISCLRTRCVLYLAYLAFIDGTGKTLPLSYAWWTDAVMIDPEWIVRVTNGLVRWKGDESCELCGRHDCMFYKTTTFPYMPLVGVAGAFLSNLKNKNKVKI